MIDKAEVLKLLKKSWIWVLIVLSSIAVWAFAFYWAGQTPADKKFTVWVGADYQIESSIKTQVTEVTKKYGMKECNISSYSPDDYYYAAAFGLNSSSIDIFILKKAEAETEAQANIFLPLDEKFNIFGEQLIYNEKPIGVKFIGDYYILINSRSKKDQQLLFEVVSVFAENGAVQ